jgi:hypothetical protein
MDEYKSILGVWIADAAFNEAFESGAKNFAMEMYWRGARIAYENALGEFESLEGE